MTIHLDISLGPTHVGRLWGDHNETTFVFARDYLSMPERPVLGQYFEDRLTPKARRVRGMLPWFENALPERGGALRVRIERLLGLETNNDLSLLSALGDKLPGRVRARRVDGSHRVVDANGVVDEVDEVSPGLRASLGGMQLKFALSGEPSRLTLDVTDDEQTKWILKISDGRRPELAENEVSIMRWCRAAHFDVPETHLIERSALPDLGSIPDVPTACLVRRYDRKDGMRIHQEDFAQVLNHRPAARFIGTDAVGLGRAVKLVLGADGAEEFIRRLVVTIATGNCDAHLKNWSLIYLNPTAPTWSPMYDQVATIAYDDLEMRLALRMGNAKFLRQVDFEHVYWVAAQAGIAQVTAEGLIQSTLARLKKAFDQTAFGVPEKVAERLVRLWNEVPLLQSTAPLV